MNTLFDTHSVGLFFVFLATGIALWAAFNWTYLQVTPYDEAVDIRAGKLAPAIALVGAEIGFILPLAAASFVSGGGHVGWLHFVKWGLIAGVVQIALFKAMYWRWGSVIEGNNCAGALVFAGASFCAGILNAVSMIP